jgi:hypothetical protein
MKTRDAVIGFIFLVILIAGTLWIYRNRTEVSSTVQTATPTISERVNNAFPGLTVPEGAGRADLNNVTGGDGVGVATKQKTGSGFNITVMANLPDPVTGSYQAELTDGTAKINLGRLSVTKSGFLVNYTSSKDLDAFNKVTVTLNGTTVLEGSF